MGKVIRITCEGAALVPLGELEHFQGTLKTLDEKRYTKLRAAIERHGFSFPMAAWREDDHKHIIDGHQRLFVVTKMLAEGWILPDGALPIDWIEAIDEQEAKKKVLLAASQYGRYDEDSVAQFIGEAELSFPELKLEIDLPQIHMGKLEVGWFKDESTNESSITEVFDVLVICDSEEKQRELLEQLDREGYKCRALIS